MVRSGEVESSVIIPCRNGAETLDETLAAVLTQRWEMPWELVFSDNGSTDASRAIFRAHAARAPVPCRMVDTSATPGKAHALNAAIMVSRGRTIVLCDADDVPAPGWLRAMGAALARDDLVGAALEFSRLNRGWVRDYRHPGGGDVLAAPARLPYLPEAEFVGGCAMGFSRRLFDTLGGFDPDVPIHDDVDFCLRAARAGIRVRMVPEAMVHYRFRSDFRGIYAQAFGYEKHGVVLGRRYGSPTPAWRSAWRLARGWLRMIAEAAPLLPGGLAGRPLPRARLSWMFGQRMGRIAGMIAYRTLPPGVPRSRRLRVSPAS